MVRTRSCAYASFMLGHSPHRAARSGGPARAPKSPCDPDRA
jgi:hypothetical protein